MRSIKGGLVYVPPPSAFHAQAGTQTLHTEAESGPQLFTPTVFGAAVRYRRRTQDWEWIASLAIPKHLLLCPIVPVSLAMKMSMIMLIPKG
jgi:hypothetical protein